MAKKQQASEGIRHDLEQPEGLPPEQPQPEPQQEEEQVEKLNRKQCADRVVKAWLASNNGDTTIDELAHGADRLFVAGRGGDEDYSDPETASWGVQAVLEQLESVGLVALEWHCAVSPKGRLNGGK